MKTPQEQYKDNLCCAYITGNLFKNYIACLLGDVQGSDKNKRYLQNKFREIQKTTSVLFNPMDRELKKVEAFEEFEDTIILYHDLMEKLLHLDKETLDQVFNHIHQLHLNKIAS